MSLAGTVAQHCRVPRSVERGDQEERGTLLEHSHLTALALLAPPCAAPVCRCCPPRAPPPLPYTPPQPFLQGRCKEEGKSSQGCIIMRTSQAVIIAVHDPAYSGGATFGKVNIEISRIADYFVESGF